MAYSIKSTMSKLELDFLETKLRNSRMYLEFGSGYSTVLASMVPNLEIYSIETDLQYINYLNSYIVEGNQGKSIPRIVHANIGPTGEWGWPIDTQNLDSYPMYSTRPWIELKKLEFIPDLILIDGRFRVATFITALLNSTQSTILFDDYFDRPAYHIVQEVIQPYKAIGRIAVFKSPKFLTRKKIANCQKLFSQFVLDPN